MRYARISDEGTVIETLELDPSTVSVHKLAPDGGCRLRPLIHTEAPNFNEETHTRTFGYDVTPEAVTETWTLTSKGPNAYRNAVRAEANRRILAVYPEWKQINLNVDKTNLISIRIDRVLTEEEQAQLDAIEAAQAWIASVRDASNAIEYLDPVPEDYRDNSLWPS